MDWMTYMEKRRALVMGTGISGIGAAGRIGGLHLAGFRSNHRYSELFFLAGGQ